MTIEEYLDFDRDSDERWEYFRGQIYCMSGGSPEHSLLSSRVGFLLNRGLIPKGCFVFQSDARIKVPALPPYRYADVSTLCGEPVYEEVGSRRIVVNPALIVEVLSPSTELYDRTRKFEAYKSVDSLKYYILVSQDERFVLLYSRYNEKFWFQTQHLDGDVLNLEALDCKLSVNEIYEGIIAEEKEDAGSIGNG